MVAELEGGSFSTVVYLQPASAVTSLTVVNDLGESAATTPKAKISARSEAKHRKRSFFIVLPTLPQKALDNHNPHILEFLAMISERQDQALSAARQRLPITIMISRIPGHLY
jgi:hypothetical protein